MDVKDVKKVAVVGAGTMGPGLAQVFACAGHQVSLYSRSEATLEKAMSVAAANMQTFVGHGLLGEDDVSAALESLLCVPFEFETTGATLLHTSVPEPAPRARWKVAEAGF